MAAQLGFHIKVFRTMRTQKIARYAHVSLLVTLEVVQVIGSVITLITVVFSHILMNLYDVQIQKFFVRRLKDIAVRAEMRLTSLNT